MVHECVNNYSALISGFQDPGQCTQFDVFFCWYLQRMPYLIIYTKMQQSGN